MLRPEIHDSLSQAFEQLQSDNKDPGNATADDFAKQYAAVFVPASSWAPKRFEIFSLVDPGIRLVTADAASGE